MSPLKQKLEGNGSEKDIVSIIQSKPILRSSVKPYNNGGTL